MHSTTNHKTHQNPPNDERRDLAQGLAKLNQTVQGHFPELWPAVKLGLATGATLLLKDNANPVAVIYVGPPSAGKTTVVQMFADAKVQGEEFCYVSDDFTPAAFVSHAANVTEKQLKKNDLLPRIKDKMLITPELAPVFRGNMDDLTRRFSVLTRVLDGQGYQRDSGTHGSRGYRGEYVFAWLGCTTPFSTGVWKLMAQLGSRLFFLILNAGKEVTIEELIHQGDSLLYKERLDECRQECHRFLATLVDYYGGVRNVVWDKLGDDPEILTWIARCAKLLAKMRSEPTTVIESRNGDTEYVPGSEETPYRAYAVLYNLVRGHALVHGRRHLIYDDLQPIIDVTVSTMPTRFGQVFQRLACKADGRLLRKEVQDVLQVASLTTAGDVMKDLGRLGVMNHVNTIQGETSYIQFHEDWQWCGSEEFRSLLSGPSNLSKNRGCV